MFLSADALGFLSDLSRARCAASVARLSQASKAPGNPRSQWQRENCALPFNDLIPMDGRAGDHMARSCARALPRGNRPVAFPLDSFAPVGLGGSGSFCPSALAESPPHGEGRF